MPARIFEVEGIGKVAVYRRKGTRRLTIRIAEDGVRVSTPPWAPYKTALTFVASKREWIAKHQQPSLLFGDNTKVGKYHRLHFEYADLNKSTVRVNDTTIIVKILPGSNPSDSGNQTAAKRGITRALVAEGKQLLPQRLRDLAIKHGYSYSGVGVRQLKSRWGSCSSLGFITLNCYLMQLPWRNIDYVLVHELAHTQVHAHNAEFWSLVMQALPDSKQIRKEMRNFQPTIAVE